MSRCLFVFDTFIEYLSPEHRPPPSSDTDRYRWYWRESKFDWKSCPATQVWFRWGTNKREPIRSTLDHPASTTYISMNERIEYRQINGSFQLVTLICLPSSVSVELFTVLVSRKVIDSVAVSRTSTITFSGPCCQPVSHSVDELERRKWKLLLNREVCLTKLWILPEISVVCCWSFWLSS